MEAFSLLKYWKSAAAAAVPPRLPRPTASTTAVTDNDSNAADNDDGPFFDLEFAIPTDDDEDYDEEEEEEENEEVVHNLTDIDEHEVELDEENEEVVPNLTFSPSDDLFFKGRIVRIDGSQEPGSKSGQFPIPVSLAKSATKFRVFLLGLKRSKSESKQSPPQIPPNNPNNNNKKFFTVKFKVEEVPIFSLLSRVSSNSKVNSSASSAATTTVCEEEQHQKCESSTVQSESSGDEKRNKKEVVQKYLKMVKIKVSKKHQGGEATVAEKKEKVNVSQKQGLNLKVIAKKHLGKSKSAVVHSMVPNTTSSKKRDDSLVQQQDGIQSAILHCKRSYNSSKDFLVEEASSGDETAVAAKVEEANSGVAA